MKQDEFSNTLANITLVDDYLNKNIIKAKAPAVYIKDFQHENPELANTLKTHFIDLDNFGVLENDYAIFLDKRANKLADEILKRI